MKSFIYIFIFAACLAAFSASPAFAAEAPHYNWYALHLPGQLINSAEEDLDGDGLKDIVAFSIYTDKRGGTYRVVSVFYQRRGGAFTSSPDQSWTLEDDAAVFDIGEVSGTGRKAICFLSPTGMYAYLPSGKGFNIHPTQIIRTENIFAQQDSLDLPRWPFLVENGRAPDLAIIPTVSRLLVYSSAGGSYRETGSLPFSTHTDFAENVITGDTGPLTISHRLPVVSTAPFAGKGSQDLFVTWEDNADVFARKPGGFAAGPSIRFRPGLGDESKPDLLENTSVQAVDLDGEGRSDLIVTKMTGGVAQTKTLVFIYRRRGNGFAPRPDQTIVTEGVIGPMFIDINGDGRMDIILPSVRMGINNFITMLTNRQINMNVGIYLQDRSGRFPVRPTNEKAVSFKLDIENLNKKTRPVMVFGRFSKGNPGYGLAVASKDDRVSIYTPDRYSVLSDNPALNLSVDAPSEMAAVDLDKDGVDDLVLTYKKFKDKARTINVFISK